MKKYKVITEPSDKINSALIKASYDGWRAINVANSVISNDYVAGTVMVSVLLEKEEE